MPRRRQSVRPDDAIGLDSKCRLEGTDCEYKALNHGSIEHHEGQPGRELVAVDRSIVVMPVDLDGLGAGSATTQPRIFPAAK